MMELLAAVAAGLLAALVFAALGLPGRGRGSSVSSSARMEAWLHRARIPLAPWQFGLAVVACGGAVFVLVYAVTGLPVLAAAPGLAGSLLPVLFHDRRRRTLERAAIASWPDGVRDILASVRSGMSLPRAVERIALQGPAPLREAFEPYPALATALGFDAALEHVRDRLADPISDRVIEVLRVGNARGGTALPEILSDLAEATAEDLWAAEQLRSEVLEQKINARAVFVLPWLVLVFLTASPGDFRDFYSSSGGVLTMVVGGLVSGLGVVIAERLGRDEVEERVLG